MKTKLYSLLCGLLFSLAATAQTPNCSPVIGGYYPFWAIGGPVDLKGLTHAYYGFIGPNADGTITNGSVTAMNTFLNSAKSYPNCKLLASVGTQGLSAMAQNAAIRTTFCNNLKNFCLTNGFNGIDVDWESIDNATDKAGYTLFLKSLRQAFSGTNLIIVCTVGFGDYWMQWIENDALTQADWMNLMIYDQTGTWSGSPYGQHSSFDHYLQAEAYWVGRGFNRNFLVMGLPFYGYKFPSTSGGLATAVTYADIVAKFPNLSPDADQTPDPDYTFFNGPTTIKKKTKYAIDNGFKGIFVWTMPQDATGSNSLFGKINEQIAASCPANNNNPSVSITAPANNALFTAPASITISANATDPNGTISKVEFYNGSTLLNSDATQPYSYNWTNVAAGTYSITAKATDNSGNTSTSSIVTVIVNVPESPYGGTRASIPGTVQAENYDLGGQNSAYNDVTATNEGGAYRTDAVDIEATTGGGYNVGYVQPGEWLKYMVNVTTTGKYKIEAYVAATAAGKSFTLDLDGTTIGTVNVPNTGGWQTWQVVTIDNVNLTSGDKILRFNATTGDFNFDKVVFTLYPNVAPTVSITAPTNNATFTAPASITINTTANDSDGSISKVEFYNGTTLLNSDIGSPFSYNWTGVIAGTYTITAKAYDNYNLSTTSTAITIVVNNPNVAPTVSITAPTNNATFTAPASVTINATANDIDGSISKVEFYNGTTLLNSDIASPFSYNWTGVTAGTYTITAKAYDNFNLSTTSTAITIVVSNPNVAPTVSITAPTNNATYTAPASVTINATANDADGSISKVEFYNGTTLLNSDNATPFSYNWTGVAAGSYTITAKAYDNLNLSTTSTAITIVVNNPNVAPTVSITAPTNNATFTAPASVTINATANDTDGSISKVEFYNGTTLLNSDNGTPFSYIWTGVAAGTYTITAKAYDNLNLITTSTAISIVVNNPNVAPTINITAPTNNATFTAPASVTINATANDTDGSISKVEFYNGTTFLNSDNATPFSYTWTGVTAGTYTITAKAYDNLNLSTTSTGITIVVNNPNGAPAVSIITPVNNTTYSAPAFVSLSANASDDGSVSKVEYYNGTTLLGTATVSPYSYNWTGVLAGTYTITAKAYDNLNLTSMSSPVTIVVNNPNQDPIISISASSTSPNTVMISATATDGDGSIAKVEYFDGSTRIGESTSAPFTFTWTNVSAGTHNIIAIATDDKGSTTTSNIVTLTVNNPNQFPTVEITSPLRDANFGIYAPIIITADALDSDGNVVKVEFYNGNTKIGESTTAPYSFNWTQATAGNYVLSAKAIDDDGGIGSSTEIQITVTNATGIIYNSFDSDLKVYPNPVQNVIFFSNEVSSVKIMDLTGHVLEDIQNKIQNIDMSNYSEGCYILIAQYKDRSYVQRVMKK